MTHLTELQGHQHPEVTIPGLGKVKGVLDEEHPVVKFLNIPFGVVNERWRPADKAEPWQGVRDATKNGYSPPQTTEADPFFAMMSGVKSNVVYEEDMSERDCLSLNIYMPASALNSHEKLPICVWLYGGGLQMGSITTPLYDCTQLVSTSIEQKRPMIMVSINYRVNFFGFISSKELILDAQTYAKAVPEDKRRWYDASVGNWGLLDQILGLEWVRDHIQAFRGDHERVTVMGQSAGSVSISYLMLIPQCHGLFHRAIMQSGAALTLPAMRPEHRGQHQFDYLCQVFDIPSDLSATEKVARLRDIPEKSLAEELNKRKQMTCAPTLDGVLFKDHAQLMTQDASLLDPNLNWVFMGTCADEGSVLTTMFNITNPQSIAKLKTLLSAPGDGLLFDQLFGVPKDDEEATKIGERLSGNCIFQYPTSLASEAILAHPSCQLTRYYVDVRVAKMDAMSSAFKSYHGIELSYVFGNKTALALLSSEERSFSKVMQGIWIDVITSKTPYESSLPKVKDIHPTSIAAEEGTGKEAILFGADLRVGRGAIERMSAEEVGFWKRSFSYAAEQTQHGQGRKIGGDFFMSL